MAEENKIHYLKSALETASSSPPTKASDDLIPRLEKRIAELEAELHLSVKKLENNSSDFSSLIHKLEERVKQSAPSISSTGALFQLLKEVAVKARQSMSFEGAKELLQSLWQSQHEENYEFDEFGMDPAFLRKVKPLFDFMYYNYWRVSVKGLQNIPAEGRGLIVANHSGTLPYDGGMIGLSIINEHPTRRDVRFLVEDFVYHFPFLGTFMYRIGGVRACPENAERLLNNDHLVAVFPEGIKGVGKHYRNRYRLQRFGRGGFIKLALKTGSPIIPTAVIGAEEIHPLIYKSTLLARPLGIPYIPVTPTLPLLGLLGLVPLPSKWTILFGEPIDLSAKYGPEDAEDQLLVNRLSETVREKIQAMVIEALKNRRSVWFG